MAALMQQYPYSSERFAQYKNKDDNIIHKSEAQKPEGRTNDQ